MDYNTNREKIIIPEYGRNIHKMVNHIKTKSEKSERNHLARVVIDIMGNMNPHLRDIPDFKHKLWDHIFIMADFDIDIDSPYPVPTREVIFERPKKLAYPNAKIRLKHYGRTTENMLIAASSFEDGKEKDTLYEILANHMKKTYLLWNRDSVTDDIIFNDIKKLSNNQLTTPEGLKLTETKDIIVNKPRRKKTDRPEKRRYKN